MLGSTNRGDPTAYPVQQPDGSWATVDRTEELVGLFRDAGVDALITIGGDGSLTIGRKLSDAGLRVVGVPKTIDNDLEMTDATFGFDTAVGVATEGIDRLFTTATSHSRIFVVEVMGRYAGWIALNSGMAAGAHAILIPEIPFELEPVAEMIARRERRGARFAIVVVAEGAAPRDGERSIIGQSIGQAERLGGIGAFVAAELERLTGKEARTVVLGHLLRGGTPTALDRLLGLRFGAAAVRGLEEGHRGVMVALQPPVVNFVPLGVGRAPDADRPARLRHDHRRARPRRLLRRRGLPRGVGQRARTSVVLRGEVHRQVVDRLQPRLGPDEAQRGMDAGSPVVVEGAEAVEDGRLGVDRGRQGLPGRGRDHPRRHRLGRPFDRRDGVRTPAHAMAVARDGRDGGRARGRQPDRR